MKVEQYSDKIFQFFNGNPILNIISLLLAIIGILFSVYFYFKSKKNKVPTYAVRTINLVRDKVQKINTVEILYSGEKVDNLSISKVALWNDGRDTINKADVALNNPIKVRINGNYKFLDTKILYQKNDANDFSVQISNDKSSVDISFDYFDFEEGIVLELFHTGNTSEDLLIDGKVKSVKSISRRDISVYLLPNSLIKWLRKDKEIVSKKTMRSISGWIVFLGGIIICFMAVFLPGQVAIRQKGDERSLFLITSLPGLFYIWFGYRVIKRRIPRGFDIFNEEFLQTK